MSAPLPVVIDTDAGIDDVVALALAALSPELEVVAVIATCGNAGLTTTLANVRRVLALAGRTDIPVYPGAAGPLRRSWSGANEMHGPNGVGYAPSGERLPAEPNAQVLLDVLASVDRPVTLVTMGPLTNLAHAITEDAELTRAKLERHLGVFGNLRTAAMADRWADFNTWTDPEAAAAVLEADLHSVMVALDATRQVVLPRALIERLSRSGSALTEWIGEALRYYAEAHERRDGLEGCLVHDAVPIAELVDPGLLTLARLPLSVDLGNDEHRGRTREDPNGVLTTVALEADAGRALGVLERVWGRET